MYFSVIVILISCLVGIGTVDAQYGPNFSPPQHYPPTNDTKLELLVMNSTVFKEKTTGYNYTLAGIDYNWISKSNNYYDFGGARVTFIVWGFDNGTTKGEAYNLDSQMKLTSFLEYDANNPPTGYYSDRCMGCPMISSTKPLAESKTVTAVSPLKQLKSGIAINEIQCKQGLQLIIKAEDNSPACVTQQTAQKLVERGWGKIMIPTISKNTIYSNYTGTTTNQTNPIPIPLSNGTGVVIIREGQRFGPFLVQSIMPDSVSGLSFREYPLATLQGFPTTLHIGDSVSNGCTQVLTLEKITDKTASFLVIGPGGFNHNCPICLSGNTFIDTPNGPINVKELKTGMPVYTVDDLGNKQTATILKTGKTAVPPTHNMVHIILDDGRELLASPGHPTTDLRVLGELTLADMLDNSHIIKIEYIPYNDTFTYDILPSGPTGFYWANGILLKSTLK